MTHDIATYLRQCAEALGGEVRTLRWIVDDGGPDALVLLPGRSFMAFVHAPTSALPQYRRVVAERMLDAGIHVEIIDSRDAVHAALRITNRAIT